jgi:hypothetical protein
MTQSLPCKDDIISREALLMFRRMALKTRGRHHQHKPRLTIVPYALILRCYKLFSRHHLCTPLPKAAITDPVLDNATNRRNIVVQSCSTMSTVPTATIDPMYPSPWVATFLLVLETPCIPAQRASQLIHLTYHPQHMMVISPTLWIHSTRQVPCWKTHDLPWPTNGIIDLRVVPPAFP